MSFRLHYETFDPAKPAEVRDVYVDVPDGVRFSEDPQALVVFDAAQRAKYPEPSTDALLSNGRITPEVAAKRRKQEAAAQENKS